MQFVCTFSITPASAAKADFYQKQLEIMENLYLSKNTVLKMVDAGKVHPPHSHGGQYSEGSWLRCIPPTTSLMEV